MQIVRSPAYHILPMAQEPSRQSVGRETPALPFQPQEVESRRATRTIEDIQSAERILNRRQAQNAYGYTAQEERQQRAVTAYQSLQQSDERSYVSQVLGIDVYA